MRPEQQQQVDQRVADLAAAEHSIAVILAARARRVALREELQAQAALPQPWGQLEALTRAHVVALATAFRPDRDSDRIVQHTRLEGLSAAWLERSLLELRRMACTEEHDERGELALAERARELVAAATRLEHERAEDADTTLPGVGRRERAAAGTAWALVAGALTDDGTYATRRLLEARDELQPVAVSEGRLLLLAPRRDYDWFCGGEEGLHLLSECARAVGLTCRVLVGTYGELRAVLAAERAPRVSGQNPCIPREREASA